MTAALERLASAPARGGVILVEQDLYDALPASTRRQIRREGAPILMPFPGPAPSATGVAPVLKEAEQSLKAGQKIGMSRL